MPQSSVSTAGAILPRLRNRLRRRVLLQLLRRPPPASSQLVPQPRLLGLVSGNKRFIGLGLVVVGLIAGWLGADAEGPGDGGFLLPVGVVVLLTGRWYLRGLVAFFSFGMAFAPLFPDSEPSSTSVIEKSEFGDEWPFTVSAGLLSCEGSAVTFEADGTTYALNGTARGLGRYAEIGPLVRTTQLADPPADLVTRISEDDRQRVFKEVIACEDNARERAEAAFPETNASHPDFNMDRFSELFDKQIDLERQLTNECKSGLQDRHDLQDDELDSIGAEGVAMSWPPLPPYRMDVSPIIVFGLTLCE